MTDFVLVPGAGGLGAYWDELVVELAARGHRGIAVDIREDDPALGLREYAAITEAAFPAADVPVLVAQSMGGFTAPMVRKRVRMIVLLNAMIPNPGETPGDWWANTGAVEARHANDAAAGRAPDFDMQTHFLHDIAEPVRARMLENDRGPSDTPFGQPCEFTAWPGVPIHVIAGDGDRFFPTAFQQRVARERLGRDVDVVRGGHLLAKSNPDGLADLLVSYL